jgi:large subunit ribosomal protein L23
MITLENVLKKPVLTEKATSLTENQNRYVFQVDLKANKNHIRDAVEKFFDVKVINVKTVVLPGKLKRSGKAYKKSSSLKKAIVKIQDGQKIEFFKGI